MATSNEHVIQRGDLLMIDWGVGYLNLHTDTFPGGEIRGQVAIVEGVPALGGLASAILVALMIVPAVRFAPRLR